MGYSINFSVCLCIYAVYEFGNGLEGHSGAYGGPHMALGPPVAHPWPKGTTFEPDGACSETRCSQAYRQYLFK